MITSVNAFSHWPALQTASLASEVPRCKKFPSVTHHSLRKLSVEDDYAKVLNFPYPTKFLIVFFKYNTKKY